MLSPTMLSVIEEERIASIKELGVDAMAPSPSLDRICDLARHIFAVPIAYVSVLDGETQWLKAQCGVSLGDMPRGQALCDHTIGADEVLVIPDTLDDERFATNTLVTGGPSIRFYVGAPLLLEPGIRLGALCVADTEPREFRPDQAMILAKLAEAAREELIRHRADLKAVADRDELARVAERTAERDEELLKQRTLLSQAESVSASGSWEVDLTTGGLTWSDGLYRLLGVEPDAGHDAASLFRRSVHPEDLHLLDEAIRAVEGARSFATEIRIVDAAGRTRHLSSRGGPMEAVAGRPPRMVGILSDVSEAKAVEARLRESEDHHRHAVELSPQIPWTADAHGRITEAGPRWLELTGMTAAQTLGHGWTSAVHPDDLPPTTVKWACALDERCPLDTEYRVRLRSGQYRWFRAYAAPRLASDGSVLRWYGTLEDIHDRKLAEAGLRQSMAFARSILDGSPDFVTVLDLEGRVRSLGRKAMEGLSQDVANRIVGRSWAGTWPKAHRAAIEHAVTQARTGAGHRFSCICPDREGAEASWDITVDPVRDADGTITHILVISRDVSEQERMRREVDAARAQVAEVLESTTDCVIVVDRDSRVTYMNPHARTFVGRTSALKVGEVFWDAYPEYLTTDLKRRFEPVHARGEAVKFEMFAQRADIWLEIHAFPNGSDGMSIFFRDVTEARRAREEIVHLAHHDPLTGLLNRTSFNKVLEEALARGGDVAVLLLDLDLFKEVNDTMGHPVGDALLRAVARRLRETVGDGSRLARLGGDEFALVHTGDASAASAFAEKIAACLQPPFTVDGNVIHLGASVGLAQVADGRRSTDELFKAADIALYRAKADGGGTVRLFEDGMLERIRVRQFMKQELGSALGRGELHLAYQPLLDLGSDRIRAVEALLRWNLPTRGSVSPAEFIPLAEGTGLIVPIGDWVLEAACRQATEWPEDVSVAVNVSAVQFRCDSLPLKVAAALARSGLAPGRLELEITESVLLHESEHNMRILHALKGLGVRIALDDFGTGFSSLSYLRLFPFDKLKLDRCFVSDIGRSSQSEAIIRAAGEMGKALSMVTTAEGVETAEQLAWLRANGWSQAQGYLIGRPSQLPFDLASACAYPKIR